MRTLSTTNESYALLGTQYTGAWPAAIAVDTANNQVFVTEYDGDNLSVINGTSGAVLNASLPTPALAWGIAYDSRNGLLYVADYKNVTIVNGTTDKSVANLSVDANGPGIAFDSVNGDIYVADPGPYGNSDNVSIIDGATNKFIGKGLEVGSSPEGVAVDPATNLVYVANAGSRNLTVINGSTNTVQNRNLSINGSGPNAIVYDAATNALYMTNSVSANLTVLNATTDQPVGHGIPLPKGSYPWGIALDPASGDLFVGGSTSGNVTVVDPVSGRILKASIPLGTYAGQGVWGMAFDAASGILYAADPGSGVVGEINAREQQEVRFDETGLPPGTAFFVHLGADLNSTATTSLSFWESPGTYNWSIQPVPGFSTQWSGVVGVTSREVAVPVSFSRTTYSVSFQQEGVAPGIPWFVNFTSAPVGVTPPTSGPLLGASTSIGLANGTYVWTAQASGPYAGRPLSGSISEAAGNSTPTSPILLDFGSQNYTTTFLESGLPAGTPWYLNFTSGPDGFALPPSQLSTTTVLSVPLANGSYLFTVQTVNRSYATHERRSVEVSGSQTTPPQPITMEFVPVLFGVTFQESGLAPGTLWQVALPTGVSSSSSTPTLLIALTNGTYAYVASATGYVNAASPNRVSVNGGPPATVTVDFEAEYSVTFTESGLVNGTQWGVEVDAKDLTTTGSELSLMAPDGRYEFAVTPVTGYTASPTEGNATVRGGNLTLELAFHAMGPGGGGHGPGGDAGFLGLPPWESYGAVGAVLLAAVLGVILVGKRRRRGESSGASGQEPNPPEAELDTSQETE